MANKFAVAGPNSKYAAPGADPAGFWAGLWHGMIAPIAFIVSLFNPDVGIYEVNNTGRWYNFGFIIGVSSIFGKHESNIHIQLGDDDEEDGDAING